MSNPTLTEEEIFKVLEGTKDIITGKFSEMQQRITSTSCPLCGGSVVPVPADNPFDRQQLVQEFYAYCSSCNHTFQV